MTSSLWYQEIMSLRVPSLAHKDMTKILIIYFVIEHDAFNKNISFTEFSRFVYRFYSDNDKFSKINPSIIINNIKHYSVKDIIPFVSQAFDDWKNDFKDGCLEIYQDSFEITIDDYSEEVLTTTKSIADMLFQKYTQEQYSYNEDLIELNEYTDYDLEKINKTRIINRLLEESNYCVCCDNINNLRVINICDNIDYIKNPNNYVIVCKEHYELYLNKYFTFSKSGYIKTLKESNLLNKNMHISSCLLNESRKKMLQKNE